MPGIGSLLSAMMSSLDPGPGQPRVAGYFTWMSKIGQFAFISRYVLYRHPAGLGETKA